MTLKDFQKIVKNEKIGAADELFIKVSIQNADGSWRTAVVPVEAYYVSKDGKFQLGCCVWNPDYKDED